MLIFLCTTDYGAKFINDISPDLIKQERLYYGLITFFVAVGAYECVRIMKFDSALYKWLVLPLIALVYYKFTTRFFGHAFYFNYIKIARPPP